jgi:hypothetical protein
MLTLGSGVLKAKAWTAGGYYSGQVTGTITLTGASTGGALTNGTYYVKVMAKNLITGSNYAEGEPSAEASITLSGGTSTQKITVAWTNVSGAEAYDIYVGTTSGRCFRQVTNSTSNTGHQITLALAFADQQAEHRGLITIGEIGGDVEYNLEYQEKEFYGQANFPIAKYFYGGKSAISAKKVELSPELLLRLLGIDLVSTYNATAARWEDAISPTINTSLKPLYLEFTHTRSDVNSGSVKVVASKACIYKLPLPFMREDIATMDLDFTLQYDSTVDNLVTVTVA